jgi:hypothetical protein
VGRPNLDSHAKVAELFATNSEITINSLCFYRGPVAGFSTLLKYVDIPIDMISDKVRCKIATEVSRDPLFSSPDVFLAAIGCSPKSLSGLAYEAWDGRRQTLLHAVLNAVGKMIEYDGIKYLHPESYKEYILGWTAITHDLLVGGADLHAITDNFTPIYFQPRNIEGQKLLTPLLFIFHSSHQLQCPRRQPSIMHRALKWWIQTLYEANIDLVEYGVKEKAVWDKMDVARECCYVGPLQFWRRFIGFSYGPSPKDWVFWGNEPWAEYAGDFWLMLERKEEIMPGTWIE